MEKKKKKKSLAVWATWLRAPGRRADCRFSDCMLVAALSCLGLLLGPSAVGLTPPHRSSVAGITMMGRDKIAGDRVTFVDGEHSLAH